MNIFSQFQTGEQRRANMRRCFFVCAALLALASLAGCTTAQIAQSTTPIGDQPLVQDFSLFGRISVRVNDKIDGGQIRWSRSAAEERVGLYSPLGPQVAELVSDRVARVVTLRQGKETVTADSVAALTQTFLGVPLDLDRMAEWVQGFGLRENEITERTLPNGDVWRVSAERYQSVGNFRFASRLIATRGDIVVRLVIDGWTPQ